MKRTIFNIYMMTMLTSLSPSCATSLSKFFCSSMISALFLAVSVIPLHCWSISLPSSLHYNI